MINHLQKVLKNKHALLFINNHKMKDEQIGGWLKGKKTGQIVNGVLLITQKRLIFFRKICGCIETLETIPILKISSIEQKNILGIVSLKFYTSGDYLKIKTFDLKGVNSVCTFLNNIIDTK